jgi:hypothetical protein
LTVSIKKLLEISSKERFLSFSRLEICRSIEVCSKISCDHQQSPPLQLWGLFHPSIEPSGPDLLTRRLANDGSKKSRLLCTTRGQVPHQHLHGKCRSERPTDFSPGNAPQQTTRHTIYVVTPLYNSGLNREQKTTRTKFSLKSGILTLDSLDLPDSLDSHLLKVDSQDPVTTKTGFSGYTTY